MVDHTKQSLSEDTRKLLSLARDSAKGSGLNTMIYIIFDFLIRSYLTKARLEAFGDKRLWSRNVP
jgi:hypothetical protein